MEFNAMMEVNPSLIKDLMLRRFLSHIDMKLSIKFEKKNLTGCPV